MKIIIIKSMLSEDDHIASMEEVINWMYGNFNISKDKEVLNKSK